MDRGLSPHAGGAVRVGNDGVQVWRNLAKREGRDKFVWNQLSPEVSAFANSEGGVLLIGIDEEKKGKTRVAREPDGVVVGPGEAIESIQQLDQIVSTSISPPLTGFRYARVALSGNRAGRCVIVIYVLQGTTAYQAKDHLYYSRSELESKSMPDHEVRLRMMRGRTSRVELRVAYCLPPREAVRARVETENCVASFNGDDWFEAPASEALREVMKLDPRCGDGRPSFCLKLFNVGELSIHDLALHVRFTSDNGSICGVTSNVVDTQFSDFITIGFRGSPYHAIDGGYRFRLPEERVRLPASPKSHFPRYFRGITLTSQMGIGTFTYRVHEG